MATKGTQNGKATTASLLAAVEEAWAAYVKIWGPQQRATWARYNKARAAYLAATGKRAPLGLIPKA